MTPNPYATFSHRGRVEFEYYIEIPAGISISAFMESYVHDALTQPDERIRDIRIVGVRVLNAQSSVKNWGTLQSGVRKIVDDMLRTHDGAERLREMFRLPPDMPFDENEGQS